MRRTNQWVSICAGALTCLLHLLVIAPIAMGGAHERTHALSAEGMVTVSLQGEVSEPVSAFVLINDKSLRATERGSFAFAPAAEEVSAKLELLAVSMTPPDIESLISDLGIPEDERASADSTLGAFDAPMLFGRYMGQIKARIERAWAWPTTSALRSFRCTAQIRQSSTGDVQEVSLYPCDMDPQWQISLVRAVQAASPLSAPPNEKLLTENITLSFEGRLANGYSSSLVQ